MVTVSVTCVRTYGFFSADYVKFTFKTEICSGFSYQQEEFCKLQEMAELAKKAMLLLMSEQCFDNYFTEFNFFDGKYH